MGLTEDARVELREDLELLRRTRTLNPVFSDALREISPRKNFAAPEAAGGQEKKNPNKSVPKEVKPQPKLPPPKLKEHVEGSEGDP